MNGGDLFADRLAEIWAEPGKAGTGVAVGARGILTARHTVEGALNSADGIQVRIVPTGAVETSKPVWVYADCVWSEPDWDAALLQARDHPGWVRPQTRTPVLVALDSRPEPDCHCVGFAELDVQRSEQGKPLRQTSDVVGRLLPAAQARTPVMPNRTLPPRWLLLDIDTAPPLRQDQWAGMSGAPVVLADGRLAAIVLEVSAQTRQLFVIAISDVVAHADGFHGQLDRLAGVGTVVEVRDAPRYREALMIDSLEGSGRPKRVDGQDSLAAFGVKRAVTDEHGGFLTYVTRDADRPTTTANGRPAPGLRNVLRAAAQGAPDDAVGHRVVLVEGSAATGKSRSAAEAAIAELGPRRLLRPIPGASALQLIRDWPVEKLGDAVVWLDDVEVYAEPGLGETFRRLLAAGAVVVATIRTEQLKALTDTGDLQNPAGVALSDHSLVVQLHWNKNWSQTERAGAQDVLQTANAKQAVADGTPLGVWAIAGPELLDKYDRIQHDDDHPEQMALVRAILDWYRTGYTRGIPRTVLTEVLESDANRGAYGDADGYQSGEIDAAVDQLGRPLFGTVRDGIMLLIPENNGDILKIHDYIRDADATTPREIPRVMWLAAVTHATDRETVYGVGYAAYQAGVFEVIQPKFELMARQGDTDAQNNLGVMLQEPGDLGEAETWLRRAAETGHTEAQYNLGLMLHQRGDLGEAETWLRRAADAGHTDAQNNLGLMLQERGDLGEAETWLRRAADAGNTNAQNNLGLMLDQRGDLGEAETWWRRAADAGHTDAQNNLGVMLQERGDLGEAETWWRRAADAGHTEAQYNLGLMLHQRGDLGEAETWWRRAADAGHTEAQNNLGVMLYGQGKSTEAEAWWRRAAEAGNTNAQNALGAMLQHRGKDTEAEA